MTAENISRHRAYAGVGLIAFALIVGLAVIVTSPVARRFGLMGIEHILLGFDHLVFLAMLMIGVRHIRELLYIATVFTLAHSITLTAATLEWVYASPSWVEPLIIATILYVAAENLIAAAPRARLPLTFGFGLIHGLGFASALAEGPLPKAEELTALFSFNLGVEVGQTLFVVAGYFIWRGITLRVAERRAQRVVSSLAMLLCLYWLWQRAM